MEENKNLIKIANYFEIKGCFSIETRKGKKQILRPVISLSSRFREIIRFIHVELYKHGINNSITKRKQFSTIRITSSKSCMMFLNLIIDYLDYKDESIMKIYSICCDVKIKNLNARDILKNEFRKKLQRKRPRFY